MLTIGLILVKKSNYSPGNWVIFIRYILELIKESYDNALTQNNDIYWSSLSLVKYLSSLRIYLIMCFFVVSTLV